MKDIEQFTLNKLNEIKAEQKQERLNRLGIEIVPEEKRLKPKLIDQLDALDPEVHRFFVDSDKVQNIRASINYYRQKPENRHKKFSVKKDKTDGNYYCYRVK